MGGRVISHSLKPNHVFPGSELGFDPAETICSYPLTPKRDSHRQNSCKAVFSSHTHWPAAFPLHFLLPHYLNINIFFLCVAYTINLLKRKKRENLKILYKKNIFFFQRFKILLDGFKLQGESLAWKAQDLSFFCGLTFSV